MPTSDMSDLPVGLFIANPNGSYTKLTDAVLDCTTIDADTDIYDENVIQTAIGLVGSYEATFDLKPTRLNEKALECIMWGWKCKGHIRRKNLRYALIKRKRIRRVA